MQGNRAGGLVLHIAITQSEKNDTDRFTDLQTPAKMDLISIGEILKRFYKLGSEKEVRLACPASPTPAAILLTAAGAARTTTVHPPLLRLLQPRRPKTIVTQGYPSAVLNPMSPSRNNNNNNTMSVDASLAPPGTLPYSYMRGKTTDARRARVGGGYGMEKSRAR